MIPGLLTGLLWLAVLWRVLITARAGATRERIGLTVGLGFFALSTTIWVYLHALDAWCQVPNLGTLLTRLTMGISWIAAQPFIASFFLARLGPRSHLPMSRRRAVAETVIMMIATTTLWACAPIHRVELVTLDAAPDVFTTWFVIASYVWMGVLLGELAVASVWAFTTMTDDLPGRVCAVFLGLTGVLGLVGIGLLSAERVLFVGSDEPSVVGVVGGAFMPVTAAAAAIGTLAIPVLEWVLAQRAARRQIAVLRPAWLEVRRERPELIVPLSRWARIVDAPLVAERMRIEVVDAADTEAGHGG